MESSVLDKALQIAGLGLVGVFVFMAVFYLIILGLDKIFPYETSMLRFNTQAHENIAVR